AGTEQVNPEAHATALLSELTEGERMWLLGAALEQLVEDAADAIAEDVTQDGVPSMVAFLVEQNGVDETRRALPRILNPPCDLRLARGAHLVFRRHPAYPGGACAFGARCSKAYPEHNGAMHAALVLVAVLNRHLAVERADYRVEVGSVADCDVPV